MLLKKSLFRTYIVFISNERTKLLLLLWLTLCGACLLQVKYKEEGKRRASVSLYSTLAETPETQHAKEVSQLQSEVHTSYTHAQTHTLTLTRR